MLHKLLFLMLLSALTGCINAQTMQGIMPDSQQTQIREYAKRYALQHKCQFIVGITDKDGRPFYAGFDGRSGYVIKEFSTPFEIGSCSKMFTATAILQLIENGRLSLRDPLVKVLPHPTLYQGLLMIDSIDYIDSVTILDLLRHSSGLADYFVASDSLEILVSGDATLQYTPEQLIRRSKRLNKPSFKPGSGQFRYSNVNYILLGMIIEKLTGLKYQQYIETAILKPLGLQQTWFASVKKPAKVLAGHFNGKLSEMPPTMAWSAGEIISTLDDMTTFIRAWYAGLLFRDKLTASMIRRDYYQSMGVLGIEYGLGNLTLSKKAWGHGGQTFGWQSFMAALPNGYCFSFGLDDAAVSSWAPALMLSGVLSTQ